MTPSLLSAHHCDAWYWKPEGLSTEIHNPGVTTLKALTHSANSLLNFKWDFKGLTIKWVLSVYCKMAYCVCVPVYKHLSTYYWIRNPGFNCFLLLKSRGKAWKNRAGAVKGFWAGFLPLPLFPSFLLSSHPSFLPTLSAHRALTLWWVQILSLFIWCMTLDLNFIIPMCKMGIMLLISWGCHGD